MEMSLLGSNFKASAVNMGKVSFDSTSTIKGMIFQFLVALERCFEMQEGQSVYIERFGDVSVIDKEDAIQIESKYYKRDLSDLDENIWNTISNWMDSSFSLEKFVTEDTHKTVWVIHIPKHQPKLPVYAHNKAWQRIEDSLVELTQERLNAILEETSPTYDWSAEIVAEATLDDLEPKALQKAREEYKSVHPKLATEVDAWDDMELLSRAGVAVKGKLTRAAILLLGKPTAVHYLTPSVATITWCG